MEKIRFDDGWTVAAGVQDPFAALMGAGAQKKKVTLPQDAMILEDRDPAYGSGAQSGFYPAKTYTYEKIFEAPEEWKDRQIYVEFEGVMSKALVYLNGEPVGKNRNGYISFFVDLNPFLRYGETNTLKVVAINQERSSRWYSGSGIYRDVNLYIGERTHILPDAARIHTVELEDTYAVLTVDTKIRNSGTAARRLRLVCEIFEEEKMETAVVCMENTISLLGQERTVTHMRFSLEQPLCWSPEYPNLYRCRLTLYEGERRLDVHEETFGVRTIQADAKRGLRINGVPVRLRGACIHHDNGILGATTLYQAEEFRVRKLKEAGFNSIRSAHHPAGKALLDICDRLGMLVMDELSDMWDQSKNSADYAMDFGEDWQSLMERMVAKDFNHPSVILYSIGNEIPEIGRRSGSRRNRQLAAELRKLDDTRLITCSFNGFLAAADAMAKMAQQMAGQADRNPEEAGKTSPEESGGSESLNAAMGGTQKEMMDAFAASPLLGECLEEASCELDVTGYNYLTARHTLEHQLHPQRLIVGSETYPTEIAELWKIVEENPHVIGDFTWTGYDYLGEAGIGIYHYDTDRREQGWYPDRLAYCGDININGYRRPVSYLREIVYGLRREPFIAVERADRRGHSCERNNWMYADAIDSWTFDGFEGTETSVHIFSPSQEVELFLNGRSLGRKPSGRDVGYDTVFEVPYEPGELLAVGYRDGVEEGRFRLVTAGDPVRLQVEKSCDFLRAGGQSVLFLTMDLVDADGVANRQAQRRVTVEVEGPAVLAAMGSADPSAEGSYQDHTWETFDGRVMAALRSTSESGTVTVRISADGCEPEVLTIPAKA